MAPHTITEPPPCLTVGRRHSFLYASSGERQTYTRPVVGKSVNDDSSDQTTCRHWSAVQFSWTLHHHFLMIALCGFISGLAIAVQPRKFILWSSLRMVQIEAESPILSFRAAVAFAAEIRRSDLTIRRNERCCRLSSFRLRPALFLGDVFPSLYWDIILHTVAGDTPTKLLVSVIDAPASRAPTIRPRWNSDNTDDITNRILHPEDDFWIQKTTTNSLGTAGREQRN